MVDSWKLPEVAKAQLALVKSQMPNIEVTPPFASFLKIMQNIRVREGTTFLDIGCGVGHYGFLLAKHYPKLAYTGLDFSKAMIAEAKLLCPSGTFRVRDFAKANYWNFDIVLAAQVLEYQPDPMGAVGYLLERKHHGYLILHRLRMTGEPSHWTELEPTYCGNKERNYRWNQDELCDYIRAQGGEIADMLVWEKDNMTLLIRDKE